MNEKLTALIVVTVAVVACAPPEGAEGEAARSREQCRP